MLAAVRLGRLGRLARTGFSGFKCRPAFGRRSPVASCSFAVREISTEFLEPLPAPTELEWINVNVSEAGEPSFSSMGLGGWTPPGLLQSAFEHLHVAYDIPWWGTIVIGTICIRIVIFPMVIYTRRHMMKFNEITPQMTHLQHKFTEARRNGNRIESERYAMELNNFMSEKGVNPLKNLIGPFAQMPFFISFFLALRQMSNVPVESMRQGGLFWFQDLTIPDQYYALPLLTGVTMWATIKVGADTGKMSDFGNMKRVMTYLQLIPVITVPFISQFPSAMLCYWVTTNFISLLQAGFLNIPSVKRYFKLEYSSKGNIHFQQVQQTQGFTGDIRQSWKNVKVAHELKERQQLEEFIKKRSSEMTSVQAKKSK